MGLLNKAVSLASRGARIYDLASRPPRAFAADYPGFGRDNFLGNAGSLLARDMDGRPLTAGTIVGRRVVDGPDQPIAPGEFDALAEALIGARPQKVPARLLGGDVVGRFRAGPNDMGARTYSIDIYRALSPPQRDRVVAHEIGHAIDELAGRIDTRGMDRELRQLYNTLSTGQERTRHLTGPQHFGYGKTDAPRELMAEAIRAYMASPNEIKTVAPKVAARIRAAVNAHPDLSRTIQFNAVPLALGLGAGGLLERARRQAEGQAEGQADA